MAQFAFAVNAESLSNTKSTELVQTTDISEKKNKSTTLDNDLGINNTESITSNVELENNFADAANKSPHKIKLIIHISVPHNKRAVDWCRIYPYPVAPPQKKAEIQKLPYKDKQIRSGLLVMAYSSRTQPDKPYPAGGWRMQYALQRATKKSGLGFPHTIFTEYPWVDNILPYVRKEILAINAVEKERINRYNLATTVFNEYRSDLEVQAFNQGLFPIDVPISREMGGYKKGQAIVDKANWWIVAMHKVAGLKYYWLWPVKLNDSPEQLVTLNEDNAICIEGAW